MYFAPPQKSVVLGWMEEIPVSGNIIFQGSVTWGSSSRPTARDLVGRCSCPFCVQILFKRLQLFVGNINCIIGKYFLAIRSWLQISFKEKLRNQKNHRGKITLNHLRNSAKGSLWPQRYGDMNAGGLYSM